MTIAIIGAMDEEITLLVDQLQNKSEETLHHIKYYTGTINGRDVIVVQSGIGKVTSSVSTSLLINRFSPSAVINIGSAGSMSSDLHVGDIVVGDELRYHDVDVMVFDYEFGQVPRMPAAYHSDEKLKSAAADTATSISDYQIKNGLITCSDSFLASTTAVDSVRKAFPSVLAVDMESTAIAQTCHLLETPFLSIRAISDDGTENAETTHDDNLHIACLHSTDFVVKLLGVL